MAEIQVLLTSEEFVKSVTNISDNIAVKYLRPSIMEAQELKLKAILGQNLLDKLKKVFKDEQLRGSFNLDFNVSFAITVGGNEMYKVLINECQYFLAYSAIVELIPKVSYKIANMGTFTTGDENSQQTDIQRTDQQIAYYQSKADSYAYQLQNFLREYSSYYPELCTNGCNRIHTNLYSAASCGIFLGGARGKERRRCCR